MFFRSNCLVLGNAGVDIVHTFGVGRGAAVVSAQSCHRAGLSILQSNKGLMLEGRNLGLYDRISLADERALLTSSTTRTIIAVSQLVKSQIEASYGIPPQKISVVPNGVDCALLEDLRVGVNRSDLRSGLALEPEAFVLLFVANEFGRKGLTVMLRALSVLRDKSLKLVIVGGGDRRAYGQLATDLGVSDNVLFVGSVPRPERLYLAADAFVFPTFYEPFGLVVLEAMAAGIPVITSKLCGATEGMVHRTDVYHLDDPTSVEEAAEAITTIRGNETLRRTLVTEGLETVKKFAWSGIAQRVLTLYEEVVSS